MIQAALKQAFYRTFPLWERLGIHITPVHFYMPIPDTRSLGEELWDHPSDLPGLDLRTEGQLKLVDCLAGLYRCEYDRFPEEKTAIAHQYYRRNGVFTSVDAEMLYGMVRYFKPRRLIEVGGGHSTYVSAHAINTNAAEDLQYQCELTLIEPFPNNVVKRGFPGLSRLIARRVQDVPLAEFERLQENDILFIDSSHVLAIGSDVRYEVLEILPRLNKGVLVHFHDIFLPTEYPKEFVFKLCRFWTEQYLLQAFLAFNSAFEVLWAGCYMHLKHPEVLQRNFGSYNKQGSLPGSFWIRKTQEP